MSDFFEPQKQAHFPQLGSGYFDGLKIVEQAAEKNQLLYHIFYVLFRKKGTFIGLCCFTFALILFLTFLKTPKYKATAKVLVRLHPQQQLILFGDLATPTQKFAGTETNNLIQILTSQEMAQETVEKFGLDERLRKKRQEPERVRDIMKQAMMDVILYPIRLAKEIGILPTGTPEFFEKAVEKLKEAQDISLEADTNVINVTIWEETPELASEIANHMALRLIDKSTKLEQTNANEAYDFTEVQLDSAEKSLEESDAALLEFRKKTKIVGVEEQKNGKMNQLQLLEGQHLRVISDISALEASIEGYKKKIVSQRELLLNSPVFVNNPVMTKLINSLDNADIQLASELKKFSRSSKAIKSLEALAEESQKKIETQLAAICLSETAILETIHPSLANDYTRDIVRLRALEAEKGTLENQIQGIKEEAFSLSVVETELEKLTRRKKADEMMYENLLTKFSELGVQRISEMSGYDLDIIDKAYVAQTAEPDSPAWFVVVVIGSFISVVVGLGAVFFVDYWDESFKTSYEIEKKLSLPVLCSLPKMKKI